MHGSLQHLSRCCSPRSDTHIIILSSQCWAPRPHLFVPRSPDAYETNETRDDIGPKHRLVIATINQRLAGAARQIRWPEIQNIWHAMTRPSRRSRSMSLNTEVSDDWSSTSGAWQAC